MKRPFSEMTKEELQKLAGKCFQKSFATENWSSISRLLEMGQKLCDLSRKTKYQAQLSLSL